MASSESTIDLLEQCLPFMEDLYLRCFYGEPWCFVTMCAAIMLLKVHLGQESWQTAKSLCAQRFLDLHYKHKGKHKTSLPSQQHPIPQNAVGQIDVSINTALCREMRQLFQKAVNGLVVHMMFRNYILSLRSTTRLSLLANNYLQLM